MLIEVRALDANEVEQHIQDLAHILCECVEEGASVHFLGDIDQELAQDFWRRVLVRVRLDEVIVFGAFINKDLAGTVTLVLNTPPNQQHRAEVSKLLVSPRFRRLGIAKKLMQTLEIEATENSRTLLVLDTSTGSAAETLYLGMGWQKVGEIPRYSLSHTGELLAASYFYKELPALSG